MPDNGIHDSIHEPHERGHKGHVEFRGQLWQGVDIETVYVNDLELGIGRLGKESLQCCDDGVGGDIAGPEGEQNGFAGGDFDAAFVLGL